ncbi:MAG: DEAD/DEAH box helicase [Agriterribacter sp.]
MLNILLEEEAIKKILEESEETYYFSQLIDKSSDSKNLSERIRICHLIISYIFQSPSDETIKASLIEKAYILLKTINIKDQLHQSALEQTIGIEDLRTESLYFFYLSSLALKADKIINIRIDLKEFSLPHNTDVNDDWGFRVLNRIIEAFILLVRKGNGFDDIKSAIGIIEQLQKDQVIFEESYLNSADANSEISIAYRLLAFYHISKTIIETASYLVEGYSYKEKLENIIRQHIDTAKKLLVNEPHLQSIAAIFEENLKTIYVNSIWYRTSFNDKIRQLCEFKSRHGFIELLPSQRIALNSNLLDVASNVTVVQMPTSAGKTLLAEFNILVTKALRKDSKIVYIVPSRALVNQIYFDLKTDLSSVDLAIEKTSSAIDLDPTENQFLQNDIDVLVTTPEKLDLLIRRDHPSVNDISLFIVDEAHTIQNGQRGAKLELLLTMIKRERASAKFMLLSPFIGKTAEVVKDWLGGGHSIKIDWKPSEKIIVGIDTGTLKRKETFKFTLLSSAFNATLREEKFVVENQLALSSSGTKNRLLEFSSKYFAENEKTILVLCRGKKSADKRAEFLYESIDTTIADDEIELVRKYVIDEIGRETVLTNVLSKKIAIHHAGLSDESKLLVEHLIRRRKIDYICSTTTIAEGVNFPVSTVFFDSLRKGDVDLNTKDFWNIAGRAGRTLVDNFGKIILPFNSKQNRDNSRELITESTEEILSVLSELFINADKISQRLARANSSVLSLIDTYYDSVGPLRSVFCSSNNHRRR